MSRKRPRPRRLFNRSTRAEIREALEVFGTARQRFTPWETYKVQTSIGEFEHTGASLIRFADHITDLIRADQTGDNAAVERARRRIHEDLDHEARQAHESHVMQAIAAKPYLLCGGPGAVAGVLRATAEESTRLGLPPDQGTLVGFTLCRPCMQRPDLPDEVGRSLALGVEQLCQRRR
jgi:hypothetical protein